MLQIIKTFFYILWAIIYMIVCLITLPIHLLFYAFFKTNSFSKMIDVIDTLTEIIFDSKNKL